MGHGWVSRKVDYSFRALSKRCEVVRAARVVKDAPSGKQRAV